MMELDPGPAAMIPFDRGCGSYTQPKMPLSDVNAIDTVLAEVQAQAQPGSQNEFLGGWFEQE
jgi:hypothetical protein